MMTERTSWAEIRDRRLDEPGGREAYTLRSSPTSSDGPSGRCGSSAAGASRSSRSRLG